MGFFSAVHSEMLKVKHTLFWAIHVLAPIFGGLLFILYFMIYSGVDEYKKIKLLLELIAMLFPLVISVIVGMNIIQEEKNSYFQTILAVSNRYKVLGAKLFMLYVAGNFAFVGLLFLFVLGVNVLGIMENLNISMLSCAAMGIVFGNLSIYIWHLFLNLKYGIGISLFFGVFESLQCILYSNIELQGIWRYIPFAWSMNWIQDSLNNNLLGRMVEWVSIAFLTVCFLLILMKWFSHWEGRKSHG